MLVVEEMKFVKRQAEFIAKSAKLSSRVTSKKQ
jgi:hypothetical protein